jgi:hypothetical protein
MSRPWSAFKTSYGHGDGATMDEEVLMTIIPGRYRHYKGQEYEVLGVARHSETEEEFVVYRALYGDYGLWIRPAVRFVETVDVAGQPCRRFQYLPPGGAP